MLLVRNCKTLVGNSLIECSISADRESGLVAKISRSPMQTGGFDEVIDGTGLVALPGMVDAHVHFRDPGQTKKEDFYTGTAGAIAGGTTTILDMPNNDPPTCTAGALEAKMEQAKSKAVCDYGFMFGATTQNQAEAARIGNEVGAIKALKIYVGSSTGNLLVTGLEEIEAHMRKFPAGKPVCFHAEDEREIQARTKQLKDKDSQGNIEYHGFIRSPSAAATSVQAVCELASKTHRKTHICHASTKGEIDITSGYKAYQVPITIEVCTHHLFLTENDAKTLKNYGKVNPPLRSRIEVAALWDELSKENSAIDCIATDHAPHTVEEKSRSYWEAPSGIPGVQTRIPLLLDAAKKNLISLPQLVNYCSANPAKIFSLKGKGVLAKGYAADIILVDLDERWRITGDWLYSKCGHTPFENREISGKVKSTILRGKLAYDGENICIKPGEGKPVS